MARNFYITTTLPYVNADPHIGFALELVQADIIARYKKLIGYDVFFNTGTDEHGLKIYRVAAEQGENIQSYVDRKAERFKELARILNIAGTGGIEFNFIRTTDETHTKAAQKFWQKCSENGYIYKKKYKGLYCVGDELFVTEKDLVDGKCPNHPDERPIELEEENYFFKFSEFKKRLLDHYAKNPNFVKPNSRFNEIKRFVEGGLHDFSISRLKEKMPWGVAVPGDPNQVMYVWFDALVNYISAIGWPEDMDKFNYWWPSVIQIAGKDNLRQQSAMWQAMLMSVGIEPTQRILIHGFITSGGKKMSKSLGNVVDPFAIVEKYGVDALRYFLAREVNTFEDSDFTIERFREAYNANLANGLGNLVARVMKLAVSNGVVIEKQTLAITHNEILNDQLEPHFREYGECLEKNNIKEATDWLWGAIGFLDSKIQHGEPFKLIKTDPKKAKDDILFILQYLYKISVLLESLLPETAKKISTAIKDLSVCIG